MVGKAFTMPVLVSSSHRLPCVGLLRDGGSVGARIARGKVDRAGAVTHDGSPLTYRKGKGFEQLDLVTALREARADIGRDGLLHI